MKIVLGMFLFLSGATSCRGEVISPEPSAEIGVFFGGQVQRLTKVEIPPVRAPKIGFRVIFPESATAVQRSQPIQYEVVRPGPAGRRVTKKGTLRLPQEQDRIDHVLPFSSSDALGLWNVRVVQNETVLADRALYLVAAPNVAP